MIYCIICNKLLKNAKSKSSHMWRVHSNNGIAHGQKVGRATKGRPSSRKGLTKETSTLIFSTSEKVKQTVRKKIAEGIFVPNKMGIEARKTLSVQQSLKNRGGKSKWFNYNGQNLQGTWELNVAKKLDELGILWYKPKVNKDVWPYIINGIEKSYTPDLYLITYNVYLEIKGYWWGNDKQKMAAIFEQYPDKKIVVIEKLQYDKLMQGELVW